MPVTLTIKQVPDEVAARLRARATASHRSLQGELMAILHEAVPAVAPRSVQAPPAAYRPKRAAKQTTGKVPAHGRRLTLAELWERSHRAGPKGKTESASIIRELRDERHGR